MLSQKDLDPSPLVQYLLRLAHTIGTALPILRIRDCPNKELAQQRALLFDSARYFLACGLRVLGLNPLEQV